VDIITTTTTTSHCCYRKLSADHLHTCNSSVSTKGHGGGQDTETFTYANRFFTFFVVIRIPLNAHVLEAVVHSSHSNIPLII
jgi:hypothetical protein